MRAFRGLSWAAVLMTAVCTARAATITRIENGILASALGGSTRTAGGVITNPPALTRFDERRESDSPGSNPLVTAWAWLASEASMNGNTMLFELFSEAVVQGNRSNKQNGFAIANAEAFYAASFNLDRSHAYELRGTIRGGLEASALFGLTGPGIELEVSENFPGADDLDSLEYFSTGVLGPGTYQFFSNNRANGLFNFRTFDEGEVTADLALELKPVPVPAALPLFVGALVWLCACSRRRG